VKESDNSNIIVVKHIIVNVTNCFEQ